MSVLYNLGAVYLVYLDSLRHHKRQGGGPGWGIQILRHSLPPSQNRGKRMVDVDGAAPKVHDVSWRLDEGKVVSHSM